MDITSDLVSFLQTNSEADMGTFGVFVKKRIAGKFDRNKKAFIPPGFTLHFIKSNDARNEDFINFVADKNQISTEEVKLKILEFSSKIEEDLAKKDVANIAGFGTFSKQNDGDLHFEAENGLLIDPEFFGLPEIDEASSSETTEQVDKVETDSVVASSHPDVENIELDEVKTDFENTLAHLEQPTNQNEKPVEVSEKEQFESLAEDLEGEKEELPTERITEPQTSDHENTPTSIVEPPLSKEEEATILEGVPENTLIVEQSSLAEDVIVSVDESVEEEIVEVPPAVLEQHAEHPDRFGADPKDEPTKELIWPKVLATFLILLLIGCLVYIFKPDLFNRGDSPVTKVIAPIDSSKAQPTVIDTAKVRQDSTAKADSVLKANLVATDIKDSLDAKIITNNEPIFTFDIIVASYKTQTAADKYVSMMKRNGYDAKIAKMTGTRKKVSIASFPTEQEAKQQLIILQKKLKGKGFYIQKIKTP